MNREIRRVLRERSEMNRVAAGPRANRHQTARRRFASTRATCFLGRQSYGIGLGASANEDPFSLR
jgi:hypothetical protein